MCLDISLNSAKHKPRHARCRTFVYKLAKKGADGKYGNLYTTICGFHAFKFGFENQSTRHDAQFSSREMGRCQIEEGFHFVHSLKMAKLFLKDTLQYDFAKLDCVSLVILKCKVSFKDHVADGHFRFGNGHVVSSVYTKMIPVEESYIHVHESE